MAEKVPDSTRPGMTRSSSYLDSIYGKGSLELVWENGQLHVQGGSSSSVTRMTPSCDGYSVKAIDEDAFNAKNARLSSLYSLMDLPVQRDSALDNSQPNSHQSNDKNSRTESSQTPTTNSRKQDLGKVNYSTNILRPSMFLISTFQGNSTTLPTNNSALERVEEIEASKFAKAAATASSSKADHSLVIDSYKGSQGLTGLERQNPLTSDASNPVPRSEETPPDEQSEAVGHNSAINFHGSHGQYNNQTSSSAGLKAKGKAVTNYRHEALLESSSLCSLGASNNRNVCSRKHDDIDDSTYLSDNDEEPEDAVKEKPARESTGVKRSRNAETHNLCERKRRDKINKRMRILKELIPNCNKTDKASMLDDAIEYLQTLKLQLQIMSMGAGFCMPFMMLPNATHHMINTPDLHQLMGVGMGFRPGTAIPFSLPQFPITPLPGITDNGIQMFGFPNQVPPMPISHAPIIPMVGNPSTQPPLATSTATNLAENPASSQLTTTLMASVPKNSYLSGQAEYATKQAPSQVSLHH
ncbi:Transcription factor PIL1 [Spatholobus suberectus]|nr:Transcription factor PIL1 [Spatholobus suberectus]